MEQTKNLVIGVAGPIGSGKGVVVDYLKDQGFVSYSLSDEIRIELRSRGLEITRASLQAVGNELREKYSDDILAKRAWDKITSEKGGKVVVESIRHPAEAGFLASRGNFHLIEVDADQKIRFERVAQRHRKGDVFTWEEFLEEDTEESKGHHGEHSQLVEDTAKLAKFKVDNSGELRDTYLKLAEILKEIKDES